MTIMERSPGRGDERAATRKTQPEGCLVLGKPRPILFPKRKEDLNI